MTRFSCQILMKFKFSLRIFRKFSNTKFQENFFIGSRAFPCGQTDKERRTDGQTDMTKLMVAFHNFSNASGNLLLLKRLRPKRNAFYTSKHSLHNSLLYSSLCFTPNSTATICTRTNRNKNLKTFQIFRLC
jgi:hypothetical protein